MRISFPGMRRVTATNLWLLSGLLLAIGPHLMDLPIQVSLLAISLLVWRVLFDFGITPLPPRLMRWLLTVAAIGIVFLSFQSLFGRQAGISLLVVMLTLKLMEMNNKRDMVVVIGLGFFIVVTVFMFNQSIFMGGYMILVVVLLTTTLTALSRQHSHLPARLNLRQAAVMLTQAAPLALLMFVLFPRIPGPLWNLPSDGLGASTGLSDSMSPGEISQLSDNNAVAFRVQFLDPLPPANQRYWRGPVFVSFDGKTWSHPDFDPEQHQGRPPRKPRSFPPPRYQTSGDPVRYQLTLEPNQRHWLFALDLPGYLPPKSWLSREYEIISRTPVTQVMQYDMESYTNYTLGASRLPISGRYLQLPEGGGDKSRLLAEEFLRTSAGPREVMERVLQYLREQPFYYTRQPPLLRDDPIDEFLFDSRRGYCEHYASSFVYLMRAAGIPARVITGYQGGEMNPLGDYFIVRQSDAHAWTEVWLDAEGWVRVDPTAAIPASRIENPSDLARILPDLARNTTLPGWTTRAWRQIRFGWDNVNHYWNQWVVNYNQSKQKDFLKLLGLGEIDWRGMVSLLMGGIAIVVALLGSRLLRRRQRIEDPVLRSYAHFCRKLARRGVTRRPGETAQEYAVRAGTQLPERASAIDHITALYQRLRYGRHPTNHARQELISAVRKFQP